MIEKDNKDPFWSSKMNIQTLKNILKNHFVEYYWLILKTIRITTKKRSVFFSFPYNFLFDYNFKEFSKSKFWLTRLASLVTGFLWLTWALSCLNRPFKLILLEIISTKISLSQLNYGTIISVLCLLIVIYLFMSILILFGVFM